MKYSTKNFVIRVEQDDMATSSREWDNLGTMICGHKKYILGDEQVQDEFDSWDAVEKSLPRGSVILPLYLYDHSGLTMKTVPFSSTWDSGQVGIIYASPEKIRKNYGVQRISASLRDRVTTALMNEVKAYDDYLNGNIFCFVVEDSQGKIVDSCGGFHGDEDQAISTMKQYIASDILNELKEEAHADWA